MNAEAKGNRLDESPTAKAAEIPISAIHTGRFEISVVGNKGIPVEGISVKVSSGPAQKRRPSFVGRGSRFTDRKDLSVEFDVERRKVERQSPK